jgi:hypothetical protein
MGRENGGDEPAGRIPKWLGELPNVVAGITGLVALVYFVGGIVLALRLAFDRLPALGVVGQLPHDFLFSIGVSEVVFPALVLAALHGMLANASAKGSHRDFKQWREAGMTRRARWRHVISAAVGCVAVVLPGAVVALAREHASATVFAVLALAGIVVARFLYRLHRDDVRNTAPDKPVRDGWLEHRLPKAQGIEAAVVGAGGLAYAAIGLAVLAALEDPSLLWLCAAWLLSLPFVLLYLLVRGRLAARERVWILPQQLALSLATTLVTVPALVVAWAAWPLEQAIVCPAPASDGAKTPANTPGSFVGETSDRVYVGTERRIVSIPQDQVARVVIGSDEAADCTT